MSGKLHRCLRVWIAVTAAAILGGLLFPGSAIVRQALAKLSEFENGSTPLEITGSGTHDAPWQLRTRATPSQSAPRPAMVELHDDVDGLFQSSPHAPIDYAVILRNLWRLGAKHVCCAPLLAWSEPDPIGLAAMESTMAKFKSVVLAAPLTRGPTMEPLPSAFRRASLPLTKIKGNVSLLPVVNRVALPNMVYGKDNTLAGFQVLDSEPSTPTIPLLARWDDRVVCSFHLLAAMQRAQTRIDELEVHVGKAIQLGNKGPRIPIDDYGHLSFIPAEPSTALTINAAALIDGDRSLLKGHPFKIPFIADHRHNISDASKTFNAHVPTMASHLLSGSDPVSSRQYPRLTSSQEWFCLIVLSVILTIIASISGRGRAVVYSLMAVSVLLTHYMVFLHLHHWLPGITALLMVVTASITSIQVPPKRKGEFMKDLPFKRYSGK